MRIGIKYEIYESIVTVIVWKPITYCNRLIQSFIKEFTISAVKDIFEFLYFKWSTFD